MKRRFIPVPHSWPPGYGKPGADYIAEVEVGGVRFRGVGETRGEALRDAVKMARSARGRRRPKRNPLPLAAIGEAVVLYGPAAYEAGKAGYDAFKKLRTALKRGHAHTKRKR